MAEKGWTTRVATAAGAAAGTGAAQLGLGYGLGVVVWPVTTTADDSVWLGSLGWATWITASATVFGAVIAGRLGGGAVTRFRGPWRLALATSAAVGALVAVALIALPARSAVRADTFSPQVTAGGYALVGLLLGLVVAYWAVVCRPVAANLIATAVWLWVLAISAIVVEVSVHHSSATYLTSWQFTETDAGHHYGTIYWPSAALTVAAAFVIGIGTAIPAVRRRDLSVSAATSGAVGPLLVAVAFFVLAPQLTGTPGPLESAYLIAPYAVLAGLAGSALSVALGRSVVNRQDRRAAGGRAPSATGLATDPAVPDEDVNSKVPRTFAARRRKPTRATSSAESGATDPEPADTGTGTGTAQLKANPNTLPFRARESRLVAPDVSTAPANASGANLRSGKASAGDSGEMFVGDVEDARAQSQTAPTQTAPAQTDPAQPDPAQTSSVQTVPVQTAEVETVETDPKPRSRSIFGFRLKSKSTGDDATDSGTLKAGITPDAAAAAKTRDSSRFKVARPGTDAPDVNSTLEAPATAPGVTTEFKAAAVPGNLPVPPQRANASPANAAKGSSVESVTAATTSSAPRGSLPSDARPRSGNRVPGQGPPGPGPRAGRGPETGPGPGAEPGPEAEPGLGAIRRPAPRPAKAPAPAPSPTPVKRVDPPQPARVNSVRPRPAADRPADGPVGLADPEIAAAARPSQGRARKPTPADGDPTRSTVTPPPASPTVAQINPTPPAQG